MTATSTDIAALDNEAGGHRIQRVPPTEKRGRVQTSSVTVSVLKPTLEKASFINEGDLKIEWYSGSGAGGQHRNKHMNSCRLTHLPSGLVKTAQCRSRKNSYLQAKTAIQQELTHHHSYEQSKRHNYQRRDQIGTGFRCDKRRTYRFNEDRVVDHQTQKSMSCKQFLKGNIDGLL